MTGTDSMTGTEDSALNDLRTLAIDHVRAQRWAELATLVSALRADTTYWPGLWGPACAVAVWHAGRPDARDLLEECLLGGFHDLNMFGTAFQDSFGTDPDGPELLARITANVPAPPVELVRWPTARPLLPLGLCRLDPDGAARLAARLPEPEPSAWATAKRLLGWATNRWRHTSASHDKSGDANVVLDRVERGERFACREYTLVLTQALNAVQIPARQICLLKAAYHAGIGTAHAVTEAWIDDLGRWAVLDGQNGAYWHDDDGVPLGVLELKRRCRAGEQPEFTGGGPNFDPGDTSVWFSHFHTASVYPGLAWSAGPFVPIMEDARVFPCDRLADSDADVAPDLAAISTGVVDHGGVALIFDSDHPYATGFVVTGAGGEAATLAPRQPFALAKTPGEHMLSVATRTRYGTLAAQPLQYVVR